VIRDAARVAVAAPAARRAVGIVRLAGRHEGVADVAGVVRRYRKDARIGGIGGRVGEVGGSSGEERRAVVGRAVVGPVVDVRVVGGRDRIGRLGARRKHTDRHDDQRGALHREPLSVEAVDHSPPSLPCPDLLCGKGRGIRASLETVRASERTPIGAARRTARPSTPKLQIVVNQLEHRTRSRKSHPNYEGELDLPAKASLSTKPGLAARPRLSETTNIVAGPFSKRRSELSPEERALWEAAIQLDLVTVTTAEKQVAQGRTVATWMAGQKPAEGGRKGHPRKSSDKALLLALATFNLLVLVALATAIAWVFRLLP